MKQEGKYVVCPQKGKVCIVEAPDQEAGKDATQHTDEYLLRYIFLEVTITITQRATHIISNPTLLTVTKSGRKTCVHFLVLMSPRFGSKDCHIAAAKRMVVLERWLSVESVSRLNDVFLHRFLATEGIERTLT